LTIIEEGSELPNVSQPRWSKEAAGQQAGSAGRKKAMAEMQE
jgi:hypothetical protein